MADIASTRASVRAAFRDHRVEGVPASGEYEPDKSEIRVALADNMVDLIADVAASAVAGRRVFATLAERDAWTDRPTGAVAYVEATDETYRWSGTAWEAFEDPTQTAAAQAQAAATSAGQDAGRAVVAAEEVTGLVKAEPAAEEQVTTDSNGFVLSRTGPLSALFAGGRSEADEAFDGIQPTDRHGFGSARVGVAGLSIAGLRFAPDADEVGVVLCDRSGFLIQRIGEKEPPVPLPDAQPLFSKVLCGVQDEDTVIYLNNMLAVRTDAGDVRGVVASTAPGNPYVRSGLGEIVLRTERLGLTADLTVRNDDASSRNVIRLKVHTAPNPAANDEPFNVLLLGDSIVDREGGSLTEGFLGGWGYEPRFVGTMHGSSDQANDDDENGEPGEGRRGWTMSDFTHANTRRPPIAVGDEATYLAADKIEKGRHNPFVRAATEDDDPADVRNGHVLDFALYATRFGVEAPDVVVWQAGTNDVSAEDPATIYESVRQNDLLMLRRLRAAWPSARIIRTLPGTARSISRDPIWTDEYVLMIRAIMAALAELADPKITLCPGWAMMTQDTGYTLNTSAADPATGVIAGRVSDTLHPVNSARAQFYHAVAAYVACAASSLI